MTLSSPVPRLVRSDGREILIEKELTIGRLPECNIQIEDALISRTHARLELSGTQVTLIDLGSHNGTWVNDRKILLPTILVEGDKVRIGHSIFVFRAAVIPAAVPAVIPVVAPALESTSEAPRQADGTMIWEMQAPLTLVRGDGAEYGLNSDSKLGRDPSNNILLDKDTSASQFHARLDLDKGRIFVTDLGSANGTWVNGRRITSPTHLKHGDRIRLGNTIFRLKVGDSPLPADQPAQPSQDSKKSVRTSVGVSIGATLFIILCVGLAILAAWGVPKLLDSEPTPTRTLKPANTLPVVIPGDPGSFATREAAARDVALRSVVYIEVPDRDTEATGIVGTGSGSIINPEGYILTNYHVIEENIGIFYIGLNWDDPTGEPTTYYECELVRGNPALDLAVLHVTALGNGAPLPASLVFPYLPVGDSDGVKIGDRVTILGFPGIGGSSPTLTAGNISGFSSDEYNELARGWLKTDALISWGNSGGMAINEYGELIGVPTQFTEESMEDKPLDTFLGLLRPINLALPLIEEFLP